MRRNWIIKHLFGCVAMLTRLLFLAVLILVLADSGFAKMYEEPKSFSLPDKSLQQIDRKVMKAIDPARLLEEDKQRGKQRRRPGPMRFAITEDAALDLNNSGTWQTLPDGRLWRLRIQTTGAVSHNLGITRFEVPQGAKLWIYDSAGKHVEGPYTARNRNHAGGLWTPMIEGDEIVIEVFLPAGVSQPAVLIGKVNKGYRGFKTSLLPGLPNEGPCNIDVICPEGTPPWANEIRAVTVYTINGTSACTGTLMNNTALDFRPYVLSANHCGVNSTTDATIVAFWNFQAAVCNTHGPGPTTDNQTGATLRANNAASDFVLFELDAAPDPGFNVFFAGWDRSGVAPPGVSCIHHPQADVKAISFANTAPTMSGNFWQANWDVNGPNGQVAVTEPGSSGSCIFATDTHRCIGQEQGGPSFCGAPQASLNDFYGRFDVSWTGSGTNATRLSNWLDPGNTGVLGLDGDPHITTLDGTHYDFQGAGEYVALRSGTGAEVQVRQAPIATTFNPGTNAYTGLATCVSLNTAVAARVGKHRVTYQPNLSGVPDPTGLQLRVDGKLDRSHRRWPHRQHHRARRHRDRLPRRVHTLGHARLVVVPEQVVSERGRRSHQRCHRHLGRLAQHGRRRHRRLHSGGKLAAHAARRLVDGPEASRSARPLRGPLPEVRRSLACVRHQQSVRLRAGDVHRHLHPEELAAGEAALRAAADDAREAAEPGRRAAGLRGGPRPQDARQLRIRRAGHWRARIREDIPAAPARDRRRHHHQPAR